MINEIIKKLDLRKIKFNNLSFLAGDASDRRYFLIKQENITNVLMFDNDRKNLGKFIKISNLLKELVSVPKIIVDIKEYGILIIENFDQNKFSETLKKSNKRTLYKVALDALIHIHKIKIDNELAYYSKKTFFDESNLFFDWYLDISKNKAEMLKNEFNSVFSGFLNKVYLLPSVFIHRDYHIDNLFYLKEKERHFKCGWIDYQDALVGPCVYDVVSLLQDARIDVDKRTENFLIKYYLDNCESIDTELFLFSYTVIAIQRHLKVLGIFKRLEIRDNKKNYIKHIPRVLRLLEFNLRKNKFSPLLKILEKPLGWS
tara:strand:- start:427 stop:1371 length:945 start_codon:yes stop_codon:yes gene_type:complete